MTEDYITVSCRAQDEFIERRSRFIGYACPVTYTDEALSFIEEIRKKHWDATHNVFAYVLRQGDTVRSSDDHEPQGTAGVPVLDVICKSGVTDVCIVVTRYFGGILLGGGGLVRAYSHAATIALAAAKPVVMKSCNICSLDCTYSQYGRLMSFMPDNGAVVDDEVFSDNVALWFHIPQSEFDRIVKLTDDSTSGSVKITVEGHSYFPTL